MTSIEMQECFRNSSFWRDYEVFRTSDFAKVCNANRPADNRIDRQRCNQVIGEMCKADQVERVGERGNYKRRSNSRYWLTRPWRKHTNRQLGIDAFYRKGI